MSYNLYIDIAARADKLAEQIREVIDDLGYPYLVENKTNQIFPILPDTVLETLKKTYVFNDMDRVDDHHRAVRICTSWATKEENVERLCRDLRALSNVHN